MRSNSFRSGVFPSTNQTIVAPKAPSAWLSGTAMNGPFRIKKSDRADRPFQGYLQDNDDQNRSNTPSATEEVSFNPVNPRKTIAAVAIPESPPYKFIPGSPINRPHADKPRREQQHPSPTRVDSTLDDHSHEAKNDQVEAKVFRGKMDPMAGKEPPDFSAQNSLAIINQQGLQVRAGNTTIPPRATRLKWVRHGA